MAWSASSVDAADLCGRECGRDWLGGLPGEIAQQAAAGLSTIPVGLNVAPIPTLRETIPRWLGLIA